MAEIMSERGRLMTNKRKVEVVSYNPEWREKFEIEAERLEGVFQEEFIRAHHIGSTSISGMSAKPIIDLLIEVQNIEQVDSYNTLMKNIGYEPKGENGIPGRRYFQKGGNNRTHHVHIYKHGHPEVQRHLLFRDYMIAHPEEAAAYGDLKSNLAKKYSYDVESYISGKDAFVKEMDERAKKWKERIGSCKTK